MRKAVIIFLLAVLPAQFVWGAAAAYCRHEQGQAVHHFGHHFHKHSPTDNAQQLAGDDADCMSCHVGCAPVAAVPAVDPRPSEVSHVPPVMLLGHCRLMVASIDRPRWVARS